MAKVLIIQAGSSGPDGSPIRYARLWFHGLTLPYLAALFGEGRAVEICDDAVEEPPWDTDADLVAISAMGLGLLRAFTIADRFREAGKKVVLGGVTASAYLEEAAAHADSVVVGEAEEVVARLLADHDAGRLEPVYYAGGLADLGGDLPPPRYDLLAGKPVGSMYPVEATRGCTRGCEFCIGSHFFERRHRRKRTEVVLRDVRAALQAGARKIIFVDDNIADRGEDFDALLDALAPLGVPWTSNVPPRVGLDPERVRRMARSGCFMVSIGFESPSGGALGRCGGKAELASSYGAIVENFHRAGIEVLAMMVLGFDGDGPAVFDGVARFIEDNGVALALLHVLTPIRGTPLWNRLVREGRTPEADLAFYDAATPVFAPQGMAKGELEEGFWKLYNRIYSAGSITRRVILRRWRRLSRGTLDLLAANLYFRYLTRRRRIFI